MIKFFNNFLLMLQFMTRIPINKNLECGQENFRKAAFFMPLVGAIVGGVQWGAAVLLSKVLPANITAVLVFAISVLITGALHVDGLGDTCDGFYAFKGKDRIIEIMKDSRIGTYACIAIVLDILLRITSLTYIIQYNFIMIIIIAPILGRLSLIVISLIGKPAKSSGSGNLFIGNMSKLIVFSTSLLTAAVTILLIGFKEAIILVLVSFVITALVNKYSESKIGGLTGDLLGATNELVEIFVLVVFIALKSINI